MADLAVTAASVVVGANAVRDSGLAGETLTAGKAVYFSFAIRRWMLSDNNAEAAEAHGVDGIALNNAAIGQPIFVHKAGEITIGATLIPGAAYFLSDTPGGICPRADIGAGETICLIGMARSTSILAVNIQFLGISPPEPEGGLLDFSQPINSGYIALFGDF
jgi:hypothetical protein